MGRIANFNRIYLIWNPITNAYLIRSIQTNLLIRGYIMKKYYNLDQSVPGTAPGIEHHEISSFPGGNGLVSIFCIDYCPAQFSIQEIQ